MNGSNGAQILISTSQNAEVYQNTVEVDALAGNGIAIIQQDRGSGMVIIQHIHDSSYDRL